MTARLGEACRLLMGVFLQFSHWAGIIYVGSPLVSVVASEMGIGKAVRLGGPLEAMAWREIYGGDCGYDELHR